MAGSSDTYTVARSQTMTADPQRVYDEVADFHRWVTWSPWEDLDPNQQRTFGGAESGPGARYAWSGNRKAGKGTMEITSATAPSDVHIALAFEKPFRSQNTTSFALQPDPTGGTQVTWSMVGQHSRMTKVMGLFRSMDSLLGKDFERGLARLKAVVEAPAQT